MNSGRESQDFEVAGMALPTGSRGARGLLRRGSTPGNPYTFKAVPSSGGRNPAIGVHPPQHPPSPSTNGAQAVLVRRASHHGDQSGRKVDSLRSPGGNLGNLAEEASRGRGTAVFTGGGRSPREMPTVPRRSSSRPANSRTNLPAPPGEEDLRLDRTMSAEESLAVAELKAGKLVEVLCDTHARDTERHQQDLSSRGKSSLTDDAASAFEEFISWHRHTYRFHSNTYFDLLLALVQLYLVDSSWRPLDGASKLRVIQTIRVLLRDHSLRDHFVELDGARRLMDIFEQSVERYFREHCVPIGLEYLAELVGEQSSIVQKLTSEANHIELFIQLGFHRQLVLLLNCQDIRILHCCLHALNSMAQNGAALHAMAELNIVDALCGLLNECPTKSKRVAGGLLNSLCRAENARLQMERAEGINLVLTSLMLNDDIISVHMLGIIEKMSTRTGIADVIRQKGGIQLILNTITRVNERRQVLSRVEAARYQAPAGEILRQDSNHDKAAAENQAEMRRVLGILTAALNSLTQLMMVDTNAHLVTRNNGVYQIAMVLIPSQRLASTNPTEEITDAISRLRSGPQDSNGPSPSISPERADMQKHHMADGSNNEGASAAMKGPSTGRLSDDAMRTDAMASAFRCLRFIFSVARNRSVFRKLFDPSLFEMFIDVGNYQSDLNKYSVLVEYVMNLDHTGLVSFHNLIRDVNMNRNPIRNVGNYAIIELMGRGAFGSVYKVRKRTDQSVFYAMKEISLSVTEQHKASKDVLTEVSMIESQLRHPNVVRYYNSFVDADKLHIIMELVDGFSLNDYLASLKEKEQAMSEEKIWKIFVQLVRALRYIHKEKHIVHRDLTPANIMVDEDDVVKITDFGLAKRKSELSVMNSMVGTIMYSCPELVQNEPYGEKADIWALGCILYQMITLNPPFVSSNMLTLAKKIVEGDFEPISRDNINPLLTEAVNHCLEPSSALRPDINQVAAIVAPMLLLEVDRLQIDLLNMEKELGRERKRSQRYFQEANANMQSFQKLVMAAQGVGHFSADVHDQPHHHTATGGRPLTGMSAITRPVSQGVALSGPGTPVAPPRTAGPGGRVSLPSPGSPYTQGFDSERSPTLKAGGQQQQQPQRQRSNTENLSVSELAAVSPGGGTRAPSAQIDLPATGGTGASAGAPPAPSPLAVRRTLSSRPYSANLTTAKLTVSPKNVRLIQDPILTMLSQLHKIIHISQLPPSLEYNPARRVIETYKRFLFASGRRGNYIKEELQKFISDSTDYVDIDFGPMAGEVLASQDRVTAGTSGGAVDTPESTNVSSATSGAGGGANSSSPSQGALPKDNRLTYQQLKSVIEHALEDCGYYSLVSGITADLQP
eukprot:Clim_evm30s158 gene=Clim_evmTU30s158